ncbi:PREDICTED: tetratricopeptide repeat protein 24 [Pseudopodoces humilis]|uniref:tetratricopeptide repeat protein 24 n=1 Tax=Pseudopodoces humilis TaxID=181119 RepID=UPI0006B7FE40|nr:PREDICTED: tetratricopeptide repeat protein 24 [Pseudopodoces humilis]
MDSEEAADLGVQPTTPSAPTITSTPTAPTSCKKSRKKKKKQAEAREAQEGGEEAAERVGAIEGLTRAGHRALALGAGREAVGCFRKALLLSRDTASPQLHQACAFNLGAAYVETGKPKKGLEFLLQSQPSEAESRGHRGSLYFSVGAAHEGLQDFPKALERFEKVAGQAGAAVQAGGRAGTCVQMGCCYLGMREPARAARCFLAAARAFAVAESPEAAAVALSRAGGSMLQSRRFRAAEIARVLAQCRSLCETIPDPALRGKLYNDIGLGYSQLHIFSLAAESFERALGLCGGEPERRQEAALLQNLGAAHNALRSFGSALGWHRRAAALHGALGNRRAQGQCFGNLAYACSQLGNHGAAAESYLHALQAFRDSGDLQGQWQACEGLGAACLHLGDPQKAIGHYQEALILLSHCRDSPRADHKRVVHKLTDAIQHRLRFSHLSYQGGWAPTPALEPSQLRFCSTLPHASRTQLQGRKVGKAQAEDKLYMYTPGAHPRYSGTRVALTGDLALEPCNPHGLLGTSGEDDDGPSSAPGYHSEPQANRKRTTSPLKAAKLPHAGLWLQKYHIQPEMRLSSEPRPQGVTTHSTGHQNCQVLHPRPPKSLNDDPTVTATGCWSRRRPRTATRTLSLVCSLV